MMIVYPSEWQCEQTTASTSVCVITETLSSSTPTTTVISYDSGNIVFGMAILIFMAGLIFWGAINNSVFGNE